MPKPMKRTDDGMVEVETIKTPILYRAGEIAVRAEDDDPEKRVYDVLFSSETTEVVRWFGVEILDHARKSVNLDVLKSGRAPFLADHDPRQHIGVIEKGARIVDRTGRATVRFGNSQRAKEIKADVDDAIRLNVSVGYRVDKLVLEKEGTEESDPVFRAVSWTPLEISSVPLGADMAAVIARDSSAGDRQTETVVVRRQAKGVSTMDKEEIARIEAETRAKLKKEAEDAEAQRVADEDARRKAIQSVRDSESARIKEITALAERHGLRELGDKAINDGKTIEEVRGLILEEIGKRGSEKPLYQVASDLDLSKTEVKRYSLPRAILAAADGNWKDAGFERECSDEVAKRLGRTPSGSFFVPLDWQGHRAVLDNQAREVLNKLVATRALDTATATAAAELVATDHLGASFIDLLRNMMVTRPLGATVLSGLVGDVSIPKQTAAGTASWTAEGVAPAEGALATGQVQMSPNTLTGWQEYTRKLLLQSDPSVDSLVRMDLASVTALEFDRAAINGSGVAPEPEGILNTTGIGVAALGANGGVPTWASVVELETDVDSSNALMNRLAYLGNAKVRGTLKTTPKVAGQPVYLMGEGGELNGYPTAMSQQVPSDLVKGASGAVLSALIFGNWGDLLIGEWGVMDILVNPYIKDTQRIIRVSTSLEGDVAVRRAESFSAIVDMITL